jgi:hypothetical protein
VADNRQIFHYHLWKASTFSQKGGGQKGDTHP